MSFEGTRRVMSRYFASQHSDVSMMADDVVFTVMATGEEHRGRVCFEMPVLMAQLAA